MSEASRNGHFHIVQYLHERFRHQSIPVAHLFDLDYALVSAAQFENLDLVKYIHELMVLDFRRYPEDALGVAAKQGHLNIVRYLYENNITGGACRGISRACSRGHSSVIRFFANSTDFFENESLYAVSLNLVAEAEHLRTIKILHQKGLFGCTTDAVDFAVKNGHVDVVRFLLENRGEGYSTAAFDYAKKHSSTNPDLSASLLALLHQRLYHFRTSTAVCYCNKLMTSGECIYRLKGTCASYR
ncbi:hypothetical protein HDV05_007404 [Chytridiales sp. JEL 0842]|nr:hypothetical protein HDV05_007404 [Chytridiales sp. JEL 0842]